MQRFDFTLAELDANSEWFKEAWRIVRTLEGGCDVVANCSWPRMGAKHSSIIFFCAKCKIIETKTSRTSVCIVFNTEFEFEIQKDGGSIVRVTHKVGYSSAQGVAAVTTTDGASELVIQPSVLTTMLEPLKRSVEIAILVNETHKLVSSVSFAHDDLPEESASGLNRAKQNASLKTETSVSYDDLVDVHYVGSFDDTQNRNLEPPDDLKEQVVLVFTLKEFKAFLQYCSQAMVDQELQVSMQFFWGGKPIVVKTQGEQFSAELVMATLDHKLLGSMRSSATGSEPPAGH